jgi:hypothetical protein
MKKNNGSQQAKQEGPKVLGRVTIDILDNNSVSVSGPIEQPALMLDIFSKAMAAVAQYISKQEPKLITVLQPKIVVPARKN